MTAQHAVPFPVSLQVTKVEYDDLVYQAKKPGEKANEATMQDQVQEEKMVDEVV